MAATFELTSGTTTTRPNVPMGGGTTSVAKPPRDTPALESGRLVYEEDLADDEETAKEARTKPRITKREKGDDKQVDWSNASELTFFDVRPNGSAKQRQEIARRLVTLVSRVIQDFGKVSMAANLQVLKRGLSRCHDSLGSSQREADYLSIVTLVEASLVATNWKLLKKEHLQQIQQALAVGVENASVTFDHYNRVAHRFRGSGLETIPSFELDDDECDSTDD